MMQSNLSEITNHKIINSDHIRNGKSIIIIFICVQCFNAIEINNIDSASSERGHVLHTLIHLTYILAQHKYSF